jgi:sugar lactone lactonase YvrE
MSAFPGSARADWTSSKPALSVLGQPDFVSGLENQGVPIGPTTLRRSQGVAWDRLSGKVFVSDTGNGRVLRYSSADAFTTGAAAEAVFGAADLTSAGAGSGRSQLFVPAGIFVDSFGGLWVADNLNNRVMLFLNASEKASGADADGLLGATTFGANPSGDTASQMRQPQDVALDPEGRLWVADWQNHRVLRFDNAVAGALANAANVSINTAPADGVLGQADFGQSSVNRGGAIAANTMDLPWMLDVDAAGHLWVSDAGNGRVVCFITPGAKANGADADGLLGQSDFVTKLGPFTSQSRFWGPRGICVDSTGALWVTEEFNHRIVRFDNALAGALANALVPGEVTTLPDGVLGQPDFVTKEQILASDRLVAPWDVVTSPFGDLWVVCNGNPTRGNRVARFRADLSSHRTDGLVGLKANGLRGDNRYNLSGSGQLVKATSKNRKRVRFFVRQQNDGDYIDDFTVKGTRKDKFFKITYFRTTGGRSNVTSAVVGAGSRVNALSPGGMESYLVEVKPKRATLGKAKSKLIRVTTTSLSGGVSDQVRARAKTAK